MNINILKLILSWKCQWDTLKLYCQIFKHKIQIWLSQNFCLFLDEKYFISFFYNTYNLVLFAYTIVEEACGEMLLSSALTSAGFLLKCYLLAQANLYYHSTCAPFLKYHKIRFELQKFMTFKRLPETFQQKMLTNFDYQYHQKFFRSRKIVQNVGEKVWNPNFIIHSTGALYLKYC